MEITVDMTDTIKVTAYPQPKKNRKDPTQVDIYLPFAVLECGFVQFTTTISTGITVPAQNWGVKQMTGRGDNTALVNTKLNKLLSKAQFLLENFRVDRMLTCYEIREFIQCSVKMQLTGKAPRGRKEELKEQMKERTVDAVLEDLLLFKKQSAERQRIYKHAIGILHQYFKQKKGATPILTNITERDLTDFKIWFRDNYCCTRGKRKGLPPAQDSATTWFTMIASVFKHALRLKMIKELPLPELFRGSFSDKVKPVLSEDECLKLMRLPDEWLSPEQRIAKQCLIFQLTTSMGLGDIKALKEEHVMYDTSLKVRYIQKIREKHRHLPNPRPFTVVLSAAANQAFIKLSEMTRGDSGYCFKLTCHDNINKHYRNLARLAKVSLRTTTYTLRHSFAVQFMDADGRLEDLGEILGNDIRNTKKYGRISRQRLAAKTKELEQKTKIHQLIVNTTDVAGDTPQLKAI